MRLNAYLARAGVASRRGADELIKAGRVRVNGRPGELNTFVGAADAVEVDGRQVAKQALAYRLLNKPAGNRHHRPGSSRPPDRRRPRPARSAGRSGREAGRRHDRRAPAHERRAAGAPARPSALRGGQGVRGRGRGRSGRRRSSAARRRHRPGGRTNRACPRTAARPGAYRADDPRGPQAPGQADVRGGRSPGAAAAPKRVCGAGRSRARAGRVARPRRRRGRGAAQRWSATRRT